LEAKRKDYQVLHLNWPNLFYRAENREAAMARYAQFAENLSLAHRLGYKIFWTVHNLYPHERPYPHLDHSAQLLLSRLAHTLTAHCKCAAVQTKALFHHKHPIHIVPHGHYKDAFPNQITREEARLKLGLEQDTFVYLFFGGARGYKGLETLIDTYTQANFKKSLLVLMMGSVHNQDYIQEISQKAAGKENIRVLSSYFFENSELEINIKAADVCVMPFKNILTSGSVIAALSCGRPVIVPRLGCLPELLDNTMACLYDVEDERGLENAMTEIRNRDLDSMGSAALKRVERLDWKPIAKQMAALYKS
jgi:glycosyltransferase involved in cell wall biosynthesis